MHKTILLFENRAVDDRLHDVTWPCVNDLLCSVTWPGRDEVDDADITFGTGK